MKLMASSVIFLNCKKLYEGDVDDDTCKRWWTQLSKTSDLKDLKRRMTDHVSARGYEVTTDDIRLWLYDPVRTTGESLDSVCRGIKETFDGLKTQDIDQTKDSTDQIEQEDNK